MKKSLALLLAVLTLVAVLASCGSDAPDAGPAVTNDAAAQTEETADEAAETQRSDLKDSLPDYDMEGADFHILVGTTMEPYLMSHDLNGEVVNDALVTATRATEERFNVSLKGVYFDAVNDTYQSSVRNTVMAGDDVFDLATIHDLSAAQLSLEGLLVNINDLPYLDFERPWWQDKTIDSLTFMDQMYIFTSSISFRGLNDTRVMYFNQDLTADYGITGLYDRVFDGGWTLDYFTEANKDVYSDLNGNGTRDDADLYGYMMDGAFYAYQEAFDVETIIKDGDTLKLGANTERLVTLVEKNYNLLFNTPGVYYLVSTTAENGRAALFMNNQILFIYDRLGTAVDKLRYSEINYGILPMPKYAEEEDYIAACTDRPYFVPITNPDLEATGIIIESMSAEGYKTVFPAYYEIALKDKFLYDEQSVQILDMIYDRTILSFSYMYEKYPGFSQAFTTLFNTKSPSADFASYYAKNEAAALDRLNVIMDAFAEMANK